jgi:tight adherence protein B
MRRSSSRGRWLTRVGASGIVLAACAALFAASPAYAAVGSIDHVQNKGDKLQILFSIDAGATPDLGTVTVAIGDTTFPATAEAASESGQAIRRTTVLAVDVSDSMKGDRIAAAKAAANTFLDNAPSDLYVGLVTFAGSVQNVAPPTTDHESLKATIDALELSHGTRLYEGVKAAVAATGAEGARSVLVLSDGADSTATPIATAVDAIKAAAASSSNKVKVDVVAISQGAGSRAKLTQLATAGGGGVLDANDPSQVEGLFKGEAAALAHQILITATPPEEFRGRDGEVQVTVTAGDEIYTDSTFVSINAAPLAPRPQELTPADTGLQIPESAMLLGLAGACVAGAFLVVAAVGGLGGPKRDRIGESIEAYTRAGSRRLAASAQADQQSVTQQAVGAAANFLESNKGIEAALGQRIEAAGMQVKPAEWLLLHAGIAVAAGIVGLLLGGGNLIFMLVGLFLGALGPWVFLGFKRKRRLRAFSMQLADTLQLMAGSLSAGLSLAQSVDTVVREGSEPIANEFRRALVEARLGVEIEDALAGIADRMGSKDFEWVVMAIRIQREVGGNLAELLNNVAETIREREFLERQVLTLSAEGRLSVWILGGLPPGFMGYLLLANPSYLKPLYNETIGVVMLVVMGILEVTGILWMKRLVKVDV